MARPPTISVRPTIGARDVQIDVRLAKSRGLDEKLSASDRAILRLGLRGPVDVETLGALGGSDLLWLVHHGLLRTQVDKADRVYVATTPLGRALLVGLEQVNRRGALRIVGRDDVRR